MTEYNTYRGMHEQLSPAQMRVYDRLLQGMSIKEIAASLNIAKTTVSTHVACIYRIACVGSQRELMRDRILELEQMIRDRL